LRDGAGQRVLTSPGPQDQNIHAIRPRFSFPARRFAPAAFNAKREAGSRSRTQTARRPIGLRAFFFAHFPVHSWVFACDVSRCSYLQRRTPHAGARI